VNHPGVDLIAHLNAALADRYAVERELGRGGMATVYLAQDLKHPRAEAEARLKGALAMDSLYPLPTCTWDGSSRPRAGTRRRSRNTSGLVRCRAGFPLSPAWGMWTRSKDIGRTRCAFSLSSTPSSARGTSPRMQWPWSTPRWGKRTKPSPGWLKFQGAGRISDRCCCNVASLIGPGLTRRTTPSAPTNTEVGTPRSA